ncbi:MAG TPA: tail fiber protein [Chloroflexia bacterium]|nr:tail fiber protein [Chloroflexia bacterium]
MSNPFIGEIRMFGGSFAPAGWAFCDGQLLPISENDALFVLLGTTYGGDGQETFALPNLQSRVPMHMGNGFTLGETGGVESVTLTTQQMPSHNHAFLASTNNASVANAAGNILAQIPTYTPYITGFNPNQAFAQNISQVGGNQPHENLQPYLCISFIISLFGIFPPPN